MMTKRRSGRVVLAGAGPGDPSLVTVAALEALRAADVVVYDSLVSGELLREVREDAQQIFVGKRAGDHAMAQEAINALLIDRAQAGQFVVRLKGGDPYIFGRGAEEADALEAAGVRFEIIPGITAATVASLYAGIPLTDRRHSPTLTFITGHSANSGVSDQVNWSSLASLGGTLVVYMGVKTMPDIVARLMVEGMSGSTPAAVVENAGMSCQRTVAGVISDIADRAREESIRAPALLIIGSVVSLYPRLAWFERLPLFGKRIAVTRATARTENMTARLRALGAEVFEIPTIAIRPLDLDAGDRSRLERIGQYDFVVLTSPAAVEILVDRLRDLSLDVRSLAGVRIAAVGESTSACLAKYGLRADVVPDDFSADALGEYLGEEGINGLRFLLPRSGKARAGLVERLAELGAEVDEVKTYEPVPARTSCDRIQEVLALEPDFITFTSSSTVENFVRIIGDDAFEMHRSQMRAASIGPATSRTLKGLGLEPVVEAETHTVGGLIEAMERFVEAGHAEV